MPRTDHSVEIQHLREMHRHLVDLMGEKKSEAAMVTVLTYEVVADLLQMHDDTGISLDNWHSAKELVEILIGSPITLNGV